MDGEVFMVAFMGFLVFIALCLFILSFLYVIEQEILPEIKRITDALERIADNEEENKDSPGHI